MSGDVSAGLARISARIGAAAHAAGRERADVTLLLAVKNQPVDVVREAIEAGGTVLGHNRAQELVRTAPDLADLDHEMHFIGHLQSNKVNQVLPWVSCVQSIDRAAVAIRLDAAADRSGRVLDVFVQVNTSGESTKFGAAPHEALALAFAVGARAHLRLRGFMTIGANSRDPALVRTSFSHLAVLRDAVLASGAPGTEQARELSMGMSGDLELAIAAGSTMVRVGAAVFGSRDE